MRRRTILISGFALIVGVVLGTAGAAWMASDTLGRRAADRVSERVHRRTGWTLVVGDASVTGPLSLRLSDVRALHPSGAMEVRVAAVEALLSRNSLLRARLDVERVTLMSPDVRVRDLATLRTAAAPAGSKGPGPGAGPRGTEGASSRPLPLIVVEGGGVEMAGRALRLEGVHVELTPEAGGRAWAVDGRAALGSGACSVGGRLVPRGERRVRMEVQCDTAITWALGVADLAVRFKALSVDAAAGGAGRLEASLEEGSLLRLPVGPEPEATLLIGGGVVRTSGPGRARIEAQVRPGAGAGRLSLRGELLSEGPAAILEVDIERFDLAETPLTKLLPVEVRAGGLSGDVAVDLLDGLGRADVSGRVSVDGLELHHPWLAEEPVGGLGAVLELDIAVDLRQRLVEVFRNVWTVNGLPVEVDGRAKLTPPIRVVGSLRSGPHEGEVLAKSIPAALIPTLTPFEMRGPWAAHARIDLDVAMPKDLALEVDLDVEELEVVRMGDVRPEKVLGKFRRRYRDPDTDEPEGFDTGPGAADWTPLERVPPSLLIGLRVQEDGGFFKHEGFSLLHVKGALRRDIQEGRLARGASTISMQTVKNVFLTLDKTLSRKLQEVFITWQMERVLDKPDILETYVNVIEWGPRIFGIAQAAKHYFDKAPNDLSPLECVYLSTVVPGPRVYHEDFALGRIGRKHRRRIQRTMALMVRRGHLTPEELGEAEASGFSPALAPFVADPAAPRRRKPPPPPPPAP